MRLRASVFLLSASSLAFEIIVVRILSLTHWRPFVTLAVSIALLGFGLAGTLLMWSGGKAFRNRHIVYPLASAMAAGSFRPAAWAAAALHLEPGLIFRDPSQWILLSGLVASLTVPFFLVSVCLVLPLLEKSTVGAYYGWNLAGACGGVALALAGITVLEPGHLALIPAGAAAAGSLLSIAHYRNKKISLWVAAVCFAVIMGIPGGALKYGPYKDISYSLLLPESSILGRSWGPGGLLEVVSAPSLRTAPGLSTRFRGQIPAQAVLYRDGDRVGTLALPEKDPLTNDYTVWQTAAAPYTLFNGPGKVVVLGFDGGEEYRRAVTESVQQVEVVEADSATIAIVEKVRYLVNGIPGLQTRLEMVVDHPRRYLARGRPDTDMVVIPMGENLASSTAGFGAVSENYLLTSEGISAALGILKPGGVLAITGWNQSPPTGRVKLMRTMREPDRTFPEHDPARHVRLVVGWSTYTVIVSREPLDDHRLEVLQSFCEKRGFGLLEPGQLASDVTSPPGTGGNSSGLDLRPVTDDRPYPWHALRTGHMLRAMGSGREEVLPRMEWGFLFLSMTLAITFAVGLGILSITRPRAAGKTAFMSVLYFTCLGLGYMAVEIMAIKRGGLLIAQPARSLAYVLAPFLLFSGIGSFTVKRAERSWLKGRWVYGAIPVGVLVLYLTIPMLIPFSAAVRTILFMILICPLATVMGLPFPLGLRRESRLRQVSVPWVWAVSGYSSAAGSAMAGVLSVTTGHGALVASAAACYLAALAFLGRLR